MIQSQKNTPLSTAERPVEDALVIIKIGCSREYQRRIVIGSDKSQEFVAVNPEQQRTAKALVGNHAAKTILCTLWAIMQNVLANGSVATLQPGVPS